MRHEKLINQFIDLNKSDLNKSDLGNSNYARNLYIDLVQKFDKSTVDEVMWKRFDYIDDRIIVMDNRCVITGAPNKECNQCKVGNSYIQLRNDIAKLFDEKIMRIDHNTGTTQIDPMYYKEYKWLDNLPVKIDQNMYHLIESMDGLYRWRHYDSI